MAYNFLSMIFTTSATYFITESKLVANCIELVNAGADKYQIPGAETA